jgi:heme/copper-type cytochrome/quinol oxidase subunit 2
VSSDSLPNTERRVRFGTIYQSNGRDITEDLNHERFIIIIIIIIIIITVSFMQGIYTHIPEKNNVPKEYNVAAILSLLFMVPILLVIIIIIIISISIYPLGQFWQEPEPSQATGMALARCILGKFLIVVCLCFLLLLDVPTFAVRGS